MFRTTVSVRAFTPPRGSVLQVPWELRENGLPAETVTDGMGTWKTSLSCRAQAGRLEVVESTQECS